MNPVIVKVTDEIIAEAQRIRAERDQLYGNIFIEGVGDKRWVGEIGEICFDGWIRQNTPLPVRWIQEQTAAGKPDFFIGGERIGMKTVKRQVPVLASYTAQITARHSREPVEQFFFASYEEPRKQLWLIGGITKTQFLEKARYYKTGEFVHPNYQIRPGHEIYNIEIQYLIPPKEWIATFSTQASA